MAGFEQLTGAIGSLIGQSFQRAAQTARTEVGVMMTPSVIWRQPSTVADLAARGAEQQQAALAPIIQPVSGKVSQQPPTLPAVATAPSIARLADAGQQIQPQQPTLARSFDVLHNVTTGNARDITAMLSGRRGGSDMSGTLSGTSPASPIMAAASVGAQSQPQQSSPTAPVQAPVIPGASKATNDWFSGLAAAMNARRSPAQQSVESTDTPASPIEVATAMGSHTQAKQSGEQAATHAAAEPVSGGGGLWWLRDALRAPSQSSGDAAQGGQAAGAPATGAGGKRIYVMNWPKDSAGASATTDSAGGIGHVAASVLRSSGQVLATVARGLGLGGLIGAAQSHGGHSTAGGGTGGIVGTIAGFFGAGGGGHGGGAHGGGAAGGGGGGGIVSGLATIAGRAMTLSGIAAGTGLGVAGLAVTAARVSAAQNRQNVEAMAPLAQFSTGITEAFIAKSGADYARQARVASLLSESTASAVQANTRWNDATARWTTPIQDISNRFWAGATNIFAKDVNQGASVFQEFLFQTGLQDRDKVRAQLEKAKNPDAFPITQLMRDLGAGKFAGQRQKPLPPLKQR